mmetsp:Transcript_8058/g.12255  ORF Transcript_8058/g.12255 Transcript_8058/m.12255 type:complete len:107 (+) Transcript_8058:207-527(+)
MKGNVLFGIISSKLNIAIWLVGFACYTLQEKADLNDIDNDYFKQAYHALLTAARLIHTIKEVDRDRFYQKPSVRSSSSLALEYSDIDFLDALCKQYLAEAQEITVN